MPDNGQPGVLMIVRFKSSLTPEELVERYKKRLPDYRAVPGLVQKYYLHDPSEDEWGGFYLWDSQASLDKFMQSDLRKSIPETYQVVGAPRVETATVLESLRPERV